VDRHARAAAGHLLPLPSLLLTGLQCLAHDRGLWQPAEPVWAQALIRTTGATAIGSVSLRLAAGAARSAAEIHWYFDLLGAPRAGRRHRLDDLAGQLVATYQLTGWPGVPGAEAAFELRDDAQLLSPAQLLAVADLHAAAVDLRPDADPPALRAQRAHLAEAVDALDRARARLGAGAPATGRLVPSSLAAVRDEYRRLLAQIDARLATPAAGGAR
jgi:catechol 2,3-dioxygenase-like lactoylglutathione lyase family enzyme